MPTQPSQNFLALPKPHHHVSRLIVLVIIMGIIMVLIWLYAYIFTAQPIEVVPQVSQTPVASSQTTVDPTDMQMRIQNISQASDVPPIHPTMTTAQREALLNKASKVPPISSEI